MVHKTLALQFLFLLAFLLPVTILSRCLPEKTMLPKAKGVNVKEEKHDYYHGGGYGGGAGYGGGHGGYGGGYRHYGGGHRGYGGGQRGYGGGQRGYGGGQQGYGGHRGYGGGYPRYRRGRGHYRRGPHGRLQYCCDYSYGICNDWCYGN